MDDFFFRLPSSAHLNINPITAEDVYTCRQYVVGDDGNIVAKFFITGRVVARTRDEVLGDTMVLERPGFAPLDQQYAQAVAFLQAQVKVGAPAGQYKVSRMPAGLKVNLPQHIFDRMSCVPLADAAESALLRVKLLGAPIVRMELNHMKDLEYASDTAPSIEPGAIVRCALRLAREDILLSKKGADCSWRIMWVLQATHVCRCYNSDAAKADVGTMVAKEFTGAAETNRDLGAPTENNAPLRFGAGAAERSSGMSKSSARLYLQERVIIGIAEDMHHRYFMDPVTNEEACIFIAGTVIGVERCNGGEYIYLVSPPAGDLRELFKNAARELKEYMLQHLPAGWKGRFEYDGQDGFTYQGETASELTVGSLVRCVGHFLREDKARTELSDGKGCWDATWNVDALQIVRCLTTDAAARAERRKEINAELPSSGLMSQVVAFMFLNHQGRILEASQDSVMRERREAEEEEDGENEGSDEEEGSVHPLAEMDTHGESPQY
uniref:Uncharacterized protein n=1 Tax=Mycena chlorophos TaxID=658473 RepID=A0ABQ0L0M3_MYCCL|nr:predicted protein [Mycena chlorophos]